MNSRHLEERNRHRRGCCDAVRSAPTWLREFIADGPHLYWSPRGYTFHFPIQITSIKHGDYYRYCNVAHYSTVVSLSLCACSFILFLLLGGRSPHLVTSDRGVRDIQYFTSEAHAYITSILIRISKQHYVTRSHRRDPALESPIHYSGCKAGRIA